MRLGIDLRFYRPEPYGLAVHIRDVMKELVPLLQNSTKVSEIVLIMDKSVSDEQFEKNLVWWSDVASSEKFTIHRSGTKYYSIAEQTLFVKELNSLSLDLTFFFTFNYPILYKKPFIYQVLDLSLPKTRNNFSIKVQAMLMCFRAGIANAQHVIFLGKATRKDATKYSTSNLLDEDLPDFRPNTVVYNGINDLYISTPTANEKKAKLVNLNFEPSKAARLNVLKNQYGIHKPYFFFVSVWRKYKNFQGLAEAFEKFNTAGNYQLVLGGGQDKKFPEVLEFVQSLEQYKKGNIIVTGRVEKDSDLVLLYDDAYAFVAPSLSEGFGLWIVEAATRGTPVLCSNIEVFKEIAEENVMYFDPDSPDDIARTMQSFVDLPDYRKDALTRGMFVHSQKYRWANTADDIYHVIENTL